MTKTEDFAITFDRGLPLEILPDAIGRGEGLRIGEMIIVSYLFSGGTSISIKRGQDLIMIKKFPYRVISVDNWKTKPSG